MESKVSSIISNSLGHGHGLGLEAIAWASGQAWASAKRHKPDRPKINGHKLLGAMAQDIRYPWVRVGEACGLGVAS